MVNDPPDAGTTKAKETVKTTAFGQDNAASPPPMGQRTTHRARPRKTVKTTPPSRSVRTTPLCCAPLPGKKRPMLMRTYIRRRGQQECWSSNFNCPECLLSFFGTLGEKKWMLRIVGHVSSSPRTIQSVQTTLFWQFPLPCSGTIGLLEQDDAHPKKQKRGKRPDEKASGTSTGKRRDH